MRVKTLVIMTMLVNHIDEEPTNLYSPTVKYTVAAAPLATGVAAHSLRTLERRYGVPSPARSSTGRRLYDVVDLALIRRIAALVDSGLSASSAAAAVREETAPATIIRPTGTAEVDTRVSALVDAAGRFDEASLLEMLWTAERSMGIGPAVEDLALPALREVGQRWERSDITVAGEHMLTEVVRFWLGVASFVPAPTAPLVLVACPEDEHHDLGALALARLLRHAVLRVAYLGADVPTSALMQAVRSTSFEALCLVITGVASLPVARLALEALRATGGGMRCYVGGRAITRARDGETEFLAGVRLSASVTAAARQIATQLRGASEP